MRVVVLLAWWLVMWTIIAVLCVRLSVPVPAAGALLWFPSGHEGSGYFLQQVGLRDLHVGAGDKHVLVTLEDMRAVTPRGREVLSQETLAAVLADEEHPVEEIGWVWSVIEAVAGGSTIEAAVAALGDGRTRNLVSTRRRLPRKAKIMCVSAAAVWAAGSALLLVGSRRKRVRTEHTD